MALARPPSAFAPRKFRVTANEDALPRRGQGVKQIGGGHLPVLQHGRNGVTEDPKPVLFGDQHETFPDPQYGDRSTRVQA